MPRLRMTTQRWMIAVAFIAVGLYRVELAVLLLIAVLAFAAVRALVIVPGGSIPQRWALSYLVTLACVYLPYFWLVMPDGPWNDSQWFWIKMGPVMPGFTAGIFVHPHDTAMRCGMALGTIAVIALFTWLGSLGPRALVASGAVALIGSCAQSRFSYAIYLF